MFESFLAVPLHFTIEFLGFLVAVGGALLAAARPDLVPGAPSNRYTVALGFGMLAVAEVLHGGAFISGDGGLEVAAVRALAYALVLIGIVGGGRPAVAAIAGYRLEEPLLLAPTGTALLVSLAGFTLARRDRTRAWGRLSAGMLLLSLSELMTAASPDAVFGGGSVDRFAYAAHALKALGFISIGTWMWGAVRSSIRIRFVASFAALLVAVVLALATALTAVISNSVETGELTRIRSQAENAAEEIGEGEIQDIFRSVRAVAGFPEVVQAYAAGDDPRSLAQRIDGLPLFDTNFIIVDPRSSLPGFAGTGPTMKREGVREPVLTELSEGLRASLLGTKVIASVREQRTPSSSAPERIRDLSTGRQYGVVLAAAEVRDGPRSLGILVFGRWIDYFMMERLATPLAANASFISGGRVIASDFPKPKQKDLTIPSHIATELSISGSASTQVNLGKVSYFNGYASLEEGGVEIGTLVISSRANIVDTTRAGVNRLLFVTAMLVGAIAMALAWVSGRRITQPIQDLTATAQLVREGDLAAQAPVAGEDEVGQLGETFNEMTASLLKMTTDLRAAAREEQALRSRIETIIESMADGLVAVDVDRNVLAFNREAEHLTGIPAEEAVGMPVNQVLLARDPQGEAIDLPIHSLSAGSLGGVYLESRDRDGIPIAITSAVLRGEDDEISGAVAVIRDMTSEREVERMKTEFLSNISHELRTPLTPIKGYAEIISRKEVPREKLLQFVRGILESTSRLERIVELLVDFAAMEAGRMAPKTTHVDVGAMLEELADQWSRRSPNHEVTTDLPDDLPDVIGDERLLRRSIEEILDNAVKFSPHGGAIRMQARPAVNGNGSVDKVEVSIADEGIGITPEDLPKIFSDFRQLDGSETRTYGGLGLGLAYVRRIAQAHDGDIRVESAPDEGTCFTIVIPAAPPEEGDN